MKERMAKNIVSVSIAFTDNSLLPMLFGDEDIHLTRLEKKFNVQATTRGNMLVISGEKSSVDSCRLVVESLYTDLKKGREVGTKEVDAAIRMTAGQEDLRSENPSSYVPQDLIVKTMKKSVKPYSPAQAKYIDSLSKNDVVFTLGPAGTGKTYIAVAMAVAMFTAGRVEKIILSRPAVEAGEKLGFLPGDLKEKIDPYLRPLYDALHDMIPAERLNRHMEVGDIEVAPLAFMRGRTLSNAFVILDEAQNTTPTQMKMFLTRLGENSRMVITGDLTQTDLPKDVKSGLGDVIRKVEGIEGIGVVRFTDSDVVRHPLAAKIVKAYDEWDKKRKNNLPLD
jgi:phosphate starvation-inducible protein PhoH and related proteins